MLSSRVKVLGIVGLIVLLPLMIFSLRTFIFGLYHIPTGTMETTMLVGDRVLAEKLSYWFRPPRRGEIIAFNDPIFNYSSNLVANLWQRYASPSVSNWCKRVIGIPGDHIRGAIEDGHTVVYLNGEKLDESGYVNKYPLILLWNRPLEEKVSVGGSSFLYKTRSKGCPEFYFRSFDPEVAWDKQPFYKINPEVVVINPKTGEPEHIILPGTPHPGGKDMFDVTLGKNEYWVMGDNRLGSADSRDWGVLDGKLIHGRIIMTLWSAKNT